MAEGRSWVLAFCCYTTNQLKRLAKEVKRPTKVVKKCFVVKRLKKSFCIWF